MSGLIVIILLLLCLGFLWIQDRVSWDKSDKRNKVEKYGKATGDLARSLADGVSGIAFSLTESKENKKRRIAHEVIAEYNSRYLRKHYVHEKPQDPIKDYEESLSLRNALVEIGMDKEQWIRHCNLLREIRNILYYKEDKFYNNYPRNNEWILNNDEDLRNSLAYFKVPESHWIQFGVKVLEMYGIFEKVEKEED